MEPRSAEKPNLTIISGGSSNEASPVASQEKPAAKQGFLATARRVLSNFLDRIDTNKKNIRPSDKGW